ncbi:GIY-YIG nuclease family protein [Novosphingobium resinovorum]|uniref:GIY-YIG nuclease family protein n=1 Tax=Novosphingobium resinovorum TaxID=158500 RepID=UPI0009F5541E|nr:GIY-YIG nuclease family protein [Novosphingobium resinovorum]
MATGTLYVLRSRSTHPTIAAHRELIHKIGITGSSVEARIAGAADDATYLLAGVDVVATYKLYDINRPRLEALIHRVLDSVRFDAKIPDRFGKLVRPREWFMVPLHIIDEIVGRIGDGTLAGMTYDPASVMLCRKRNEPA